MASNRIENCASIIVSDIKFPLMIVGWLSSLKIPAPLSAVLNSNNIFGITRIPISQNRHYPQQTEFTCPARTPINRHHHP